ncbi:LacI family DNA-binding transcriptional regulator [Spiractinospora alimapuensis]|uniref:LacI family DNA-binding transcriptional regulator n=1 Tax=Spiractinospora alimapuensis TaxID=2820884 RepID=UPI001F46E531|nr:LacI family DNA-binding transcriptional regulator [Spiractinospora alimapuensis]QVQ52267.1 LacI family DNA-binding transcriptional regulator [Spiractinospora alimapuensis]
MSSLGAAKATLSDVARRAGVSIATASQVYAGKRPVSKETRRRVLEAASAIGFKATRGEPTIGVLIRPPEALSGFAFGTATFANLAGAVAVAGLNRGFAVFTSQGAEDAIAHVPRLDGCVVLSPGYRDATLDALLRKGIPTVAFDPDPAVSAFQWWVGLDYRRSITGLLTHLFDRGARRPAVLVGQTDNAYRRSILWVYSNTLTTRGMAPTIRIADNNEGQLSATDVTTRLLQGRNPPDSVITSSSVFAEGALNAALRLGVDVPGRFMVATVLDGPVAELARPSITALHLDMTTTANRLLDLLTARLRTDQPAQAPVTLPLDLVVRESTRRTPTDTSPAPDATAAP